MTTAHRDLATREPWIRSLERSRRRRELLPKVRRENKRKKQMSAALATAMVAGPGAPLAAAQVSGDVSAAVAAESPANRAIEIREGGLPLQTGSQGELVAEVQRALHVTADGVFGVQTDAAVRSYQQAAGLQVDGIVGLATWGSLFSTHTASGASIGGSHIPPQVRERVEQTVQRAGAQLGGQGVGAPNAGTTTPTSTPAPAPTGQACGSSTISSPLHGTVTSDFGPRDGRNHDGIDIAAPTGTAVRAAACGTVNLAGQQSGYGNIVCITHTSQFSTCYAHLSRFAVSSGARVQQGQVIGYVGCTGNCTGPHLHFETRVGGTARDPKPYLGGATIPGASATATATASRTSTGQTETLAGANIGGSTTPTATQATAAVPGTTTTDTGAVTTAAPETVSATQQASVTTPAATQPLPAQSVPAATMPAEPVATTTEAAVAPAEPVAAPTPATAAAPAPATTAAPAPAATAPAESAPAATPPGLAVAAATPAGTVSNGRVTGEVQPGQAEAQASSVVGSN